MTGESVGVAHVVGGVMDCADVRKADHADDEQTKGHRQNGLNDNVRSGFNGCKTGSLRLLHDDPRSPSDPSPLHRPMRPNFSIGDGHRGW